MTDRLLAVAMIAATLSVSYPLCMRAAPRRGLMRVVERMCAGIILCYPTPGEDCWALAKKYNTTCRHILDANGLEDGAHIRPGELVLIPISQ